MSIKKEYTFDDLIGIPFLYGGRDRQGVDCLGLVFLVYEKFGIKIRNYDIVCDALKQVEYESHSVDNAIKKYKVQWEQIEYPEIPCVITMGGCLRLPNICTHLGIYIIEGKFIHILEGRTSCIVRMDNLLFSKRMSGFYRYVE